MLMANKYNTASLFWSSSPCKLSLVHAVVAYNNMTTCVLLLLFHRWTAYMQHSIGYFRPSHVQWRLIPCRCWRRFSPTFKGTFAYSSKGATLPGGGAVPTAAHVVMDARVRAILVAHARTMVIPVPYRAHVRLRGYAYTITDHEVAN